MERSVQRSHVAALKLFLGAAGAALAAPSAGAACAAFTSSISSTGCMLMLPNGQSSAHLLQPMHQSSMMISRLSLRRIEPTGHCVMHNGSRHVRHVVATRYLS